MKAKIGVGSSRGSNAETAGKQAVEQALAQLSGQDADLVFLFSTHNLDPEQTLAGARAATGDSVPLIGGCSTGVIVTNLYTGRGSDGDPR